MTATPPATIAVTVIGGFLGAGKTTFLNHLLLSGRNRTAVLVNDFGAVNIDASLIARHDGATMTLTNGCVCCSIGGGFLETLGRVLDQEIPFEHIIIEASGVGDPWRIAEIALIEPDLRLHAVIVVADASRIAALLTDARVGDTVRNQFARCDLVLLSKTDLTDDAARAAAYAAITALRDGMRIIETSPHGMPDLTQLVGKAAPRFKPAPRFRAEAVPDSAEHERVFRRWCYQRAGCFDRARLEDALAALPPSLLRLKGWCQVAGEREAVLLQMAGPNWSLTAAADAELADSHPDGIMLVGIGADDLPDSGELDRILDCALTFPADAGAPCRSIADNSTIQPPTPQFHPSR
jgi:G3E family GTPase